ncbi:MAG: hypothetical protein F6J94_19595 [Moorea sp. SIO1F2]|uniref:hypothetical protein n=1 Tax=Moorena sp. SIO1F2 TaxID=2607819 RepID=UPI0013BBA0E4|nr:hypothetical protein [Moorena sp. SIO1F2]NET84041.1 hypothetical protein [Moorena sp. SIO1F2]
MTFNLQLSTFNFQPSTFNLQPSTFPTPSTKGEQVVTFTIQLPSSQFSLNCDAMW